MLLQLLLILLSFLHLKVMSKNCKCSCQGLDHRGQGHKKLTLRTESVLKGYISRWRHKICSETLYRSVWKLDAAVQASSSVSTRRGIRRHPGPFSVLSSWCSVLSTCAARHASIFDTTTNVGTPSASAKPRCSLLVPTEMHHSQL